MTSLARVRTVLAGFQGAPGVATHYFLDTDTALASLHDWWSRFVNQMPTGMTAQVQNTGDIIEDTTGEIVDAFTLAPVAVVTGAGGANYTSAQGILINWTTGTILDGRRLRGKTFMVPLATSQIDTTGLIAAAQATAQAGSAATFISEQSTSFCIWHRPVEAKEADGSRPAVTARAGGHGLVIGGSVPRKLAVLRSRRD